MDILELIKQLPKPLIDATDKMVRSVGASLAPKIRCIRSNNEPYIGVATDGSNVICERRGSTIVLFSAISVTFRFDGAKYDVTSYSEIDPSNFLFIAIPKFASVSRANTLMRSLEYEVTLSEIRKDDERTLVMMDGSYASTLLDSGRILNQVYKDLSDIYSANRNELADILRKIEVGMREIMKNLAREKPLNRAKKFFEDYYTYIDMLSSGILDLVAPKARISLINFIVMSLEQSYALLGLRDLIETCRENEILLAWISKDSESRILSKNFGAFSLLNDITIMDIVLDKDKYIILNEIADIPAITKKWLMTRIGGKDVYFVPRELVDGIYDVYGEYITAYPKYLDYSIQITAPKSIVSDNDVDTIISMLRNISPLGYPEPLILVHNRTKIAKELVESISEGLYQRVRGRINPLIRNMIGDIGRQRIGI